MLVIQIGIIETSINKAITNYEHDKDVYNLITAIAEIADKRIHYAHHRIHFNEKLNERWSKLTMR